MEQHCENELRSLEERQRLEMSAFKAPAKRETKIPYRE